MDQMDILTKFGVPTGILMGIAFFVWRVLVWFKPYAVKVIEAHLNLVNTTSETVGSLKTTMEKIATTQEQHAKLLLSIEKWASAKNTP